jgi:PAS domain S-box-containing protein
LGDRPPSRREPTRQELIAELETLRSTAQRYRALVETTHDLIVELDAEGRVAFVNPSCEEVLGYPPEELIGTTPFSLLHGDDVEPLAERFLDRVASSRRRGTGRVFRARHRDGSWRWLEGSGVNVTGPRGEPRVVAVCRDVTERVRETEERQRLDEQVERAKRLESLAMLASGVAHDFNNLLTPILGSASLACLDLPAESPLRARLAKIERAARRAAALTHQLLDYAGMGTLAPEPLDVSRSVRDLEHLLHSAASQRADLALELDPAPPLVDADPSQLGQLLVQLVANASDAIAAREAGPGRIAVRTGRVAVSAEQLSQHILGAGLPGGGYAFVEVQDDGCGMDAPTRERVFDPFFTTQWSGRGLGLATVVGIVRRHRGAIDLETALGRGTRVRVLLPVRGPVGAAAEASGADWRGSGVVLVADDDDGARELIAETLGRAGFEVVAASSGAEAVERFRARAAAVRLVVLDRTMPGTSGVEVLDAIRATRPEVPILVVSGYCDDGRPAPGAGRRVSAFLEKPFLPDALLGRVRGMLDGKPIEYPRHPPWSSITS